MRRTGLLLVVGVVVAVAALNMGAVAPVPAQPSPEIEQLKNEVAALRQRVESLEQQLKKGFIPAPFPSGKPMPGVIDPYHGLGQVQPDWKPFEFNGMTYYIVPINQAHAPAGETRNQVPPDKTPTTPAPTDNSDKR